MPSMTIVRDSLPSVSIKLAMIAKGALATPSPAMIVVGAVITGASATASTRTSIVSDVVAEPVWTVVLVDVGADSVAMAVTHS